MAAKLPAKSFLSFMRVGKGPDDGNLPLTTVTSAAPDAVVAIQANFPGAIHDSIFISTCAKRLAPLGFHLSHCIALVNTCRDEVCRPIVSCIDKEFGLSFNISGLGGTVTCGKTGFKAAMSHSPINKAHPDEHEKERYVFFAFPHVSVGENGEVGSLLRRGRGMPSSACGALKAILGDVNAKKPIVEDEDDYEYVSLKKKVVKQPIIANATRELTLVDVTKAALDAITTDIETLIAATVDPKVADYAVITGVQIHSGAQIPGEEFKLERTFDYVAPGKMYTVIGGVKKNFTLQ